MIALIAIPTVSSVIEMSKKNSVKVSTKNYVDAIENRLAMDNLTGKKSITNGISNINNIYTLDVKGNIPSSGYIKVSNEAEIRSGAFCINGYYVTYVNGTATIIDSKKCSDMKEPIALRSLINNNYTITTVPKTSIGSEISLGDERELLATTDMQGKSYYFRGNIDNNYISFAGYLWRIVRINGDGSFRLIAESSIGNVPYNENYNDIIYMGYTYVKDGITYDSTIKKYLENWFNDNVITNSDSDLLVKNIYCSDTTMYDDTHTVTYNRLFNQKNPSLLCSNPLYTHYMNIGLIMADEIVFAGAIANVDNTTFYLYNGDYWYTMSPAGYEASRAKILYYSNTENSFLKTISSYYERGVRAVINIHSNVQVITGNGTKDDPYIIFGG